MLNYNTVKKDLTESGYSYQAKFIGSKTMAKINAWYKQADFHQKTYQAELEKTSDSLKKARRLLWNDTTFWKEILYESNISSLVTGLLKEPTLIYHALFNKETGGSEVKLHQDQYLWNYEYANAFNIWFCLDKATVQNGCIQLFPGSHKLKEIPHSTNGDHHPYIKQEQLAKIGIANKKHIEMNPGDILLWHRYMVHGSDKNLSEQRRRGIVMVFVEKKQVINENVDRYYI